LRPGLRRLANTWITYGFAGFLLLIAAWRDFFPDWVAATQIAYHWMGLGAFYVWIRSGRTRDLADPGLVFEQVLFGASAIVLSYALSPQARGASLQLLCLVLVFDMHRLSPRQLHIAAWGAVAMLSATLAVSWALNPEHFRLRRELLTLVMAGVQLPVLSLVAREVRTMRQRQLQQRIELQGTLDTLQQLSQRDALTGLFNRHHLGRLLQAELKRFARQGRCFSVALLDIDHFKQINDQHGHAVGDEVLRTFARLAREALPQADSIGRWGGEEFLLIVPELGAAQAQAQVERLKQHIECFDWTSVAPGLAMRFSAGVADHTLVDEPEHRLLERADQALYRAKAQGRNQVCVAQTPGGHA